MIQFDNNEIKQIYYNGYYITSVYACGGNLVWSGDTPTPPSSGTGKIHFYNNLSGNSATTSCVTGFTDVSTLAYPRNYEFEISGSTICGLRGIDAFGTVNRGICSVILPDGTTEISDNGFMSQDAPSIITSDVPVIALNEGLQTIGNYAFCGYLKEVDVMANGSLIIPSTVTSIGYHAFNLDNASFQSSTTYALNLRVYFKSQTPPSMDTIFGDTGSQMNGVINVYVPTGTAEAYRTALGYPTIQITEYDGNITYISDSWSYYHLSHQGLL